MGYGEMAGYSWIGMTMGLASSVYETRRSVLRK